MNTAQCKASLLKALRNEDVVSVHVSKFPKSVRFSATIMINGEAVPYNYHCAPATSTGRAIGELVRWIKEERD